jgi:RNA polymerase sigma-70 factor (ECF subfamily)
VGGMTETRSSLIRRVRDAADTRSWAEFVALYEPLLMSYVLSRGLPLDDAQDVVQDILIGLLKALPNFELDHRQGRFRTWLWQVTRNAIVSAARRKNRRGNAEGEWKRRFTGVVDTPGQIEDAQWTRAYRQRVLDFALGRVREQTQPRTWACFAKHLLEGRPSAAVAAELGLTANAVYVNASRVLGRVREQCLEYLEELGDA